MTISMDLIKQLREETGVSIAKCKEALEEAQGDIGAAREILKAYSSTAAEKKSDRALGAGRLFSYIHANKQVGTLLELMCETDFVSANEHFEQLGNDLALHITAMGSTKEGILEEPFVKNPEMTIQALVNEAIQKTGERIDIGRIARFAVNQD